MHCTATSPRVHAPPVGVTVARRRLRPNNLDRGILRGKRSIEVKSGLDIEMEFLQHFARCGIAQIILVDNLHLYRVVACLEVWLNLEAELQNGRLVGRCGIYGILYHQLLLMQRACNVFFLV